MGMFSNKDCVFSGYKNLKSSSNYKIMIENDYILYNCINKHPKNLQVYNQQVLLMLGTHSYID